jgi:hypothetical protein
MPETRSKSQAKKDYWKNITPEERSSRARRIALIKQSKMTQKEKTDHARMMLKAKNKKNVTTSS